MSDRFVNDNVLDILVGKSVRKIFRGITEPYTTEEIIKAFVYGVVNGKVELQQKGEREKNEQSI